MSQIPAELEDHVLDGLRGNRTALARCTLVCKSWRHRARYNLFHAINIDWSNRSRTLLLLEALLETHELVHTLVVSSQAGLKPDEFVGLLEALENLEVLSIFAPKRDMGVLRLIYLVSADIAWGELFLLAIANMENLRVLDLAIESRLYGWLRSVATRPIGNLPVRGLRRLQVLAGDVLPELRLQTLWTAITAAKAEEGASPMLQFGTSLNRRGVQPLARFLESSGAQLRALQLDLRTDPSWQEQDAAEAMQRSGFSLSSCRSLRVLTLSLDAPSRRESSNIAVGAAFLRTATRNVALEHVVVTIDDLADRCFDIPGVLARFDALEKSMLNLPQLRRVDLVLAPSDLFAHLPSRVSDISSTVDMLKKHLPRLQQNKRIETTWTGLNT